MHRKLGFRTSDTFQKIGLDGELKPDQFFDVFAELSKMSAELYAATWEARRLLALVKEYENEQSNSQSNC